MSDLIFWYIVMSPVFVWAAYHIGQDHGISEGFRLAKQALNMEIPHE